MNIVTKISNSVNLPTNLSIDELESGYIYIPTDDSDVRIVVLDDIKLYIGDSVELLDLPAWHDTKFVLAPAGDKTLITFVQD